MNNLLLLLCTFLVLGSCSKPKKAQQPTHMPVMDVRKRLPLELILERGKQNYRLKEPIRVNFVLKNVSKKTLSVIKRFAIGYEGIAELWLEIRNADGSFYEGYKKTRPHIGYVMPVSQLLPPGKTKEIRYNINLFYPIVLPGTYKIRAIYRAEVFDNAPPDLYTKKVYSNWIKIKVKR